ncbi:MAG: hypothetical protein ABR987_05470 [Terracidiphilus sp.]|jgi:hypothetical protein
MTGNGDELELKERLGLIGTMIAEGRKTTRSWGWIFVLWGAAYYLALALTAATHSPLAWPATLMSALAAMAVVIWRNRSRQPVTTVARALGAIWSAMAISLCILLFALMVSQRLNHQIFVAVLGAMLGTANAASSILLRWKTQFACAAVWWTVAATVCLSSVATSLMVLFAAIFLCQIVFGAYGMIAENRERDQGAAHA